MKRLKFQQNLPVSVMNVSNNFDQEVNLDSLESALTSNLLNPLEERIEKRLDTINILKSKLKLLQGKLQASSPDLHIYSKESVLEKYDSAIEAKIIERQTVKHVSHTEVVRNLIIGKSPLDQETVEQHKRTIVELLKDFKGAETELHNLQTEFSSLEDSYSRLRVEWAKEVDQLKMLKSSMPSSGESELSGRTYEKLCACVEKLKLMRWLISKLVCVRTDYDWLADPKDCLNALKLTRNKYTLDSYIE